MTDYSRLNFFESLIGIPWVDKGRDYIGFDCYGLIVIAYRDGLGINLPCYSERYVSAADNEDIRRLIAGEIGSWDEIEPGSEQTWDCVLMRGDHIGLVIEPGRVLHCPHGGTSVIQNYRVSPMRHRVLGFYRYRG